MRNTNVLHTARRAEVLPSFSAVKNDEPKRLKPMNKKASAYIFIPVSAIRRTLLTPFAYKFPKGSDNGKTKIDVITDITPSVSKALLNKLLRVSVLFAP